MHLLLLAASEPSEKQQSCHPEGRVCPRDLLFSLHLRKSRSLASLGMTAKTIFSAGCEAVTHKDDSSFSL
jgi:hypothetical protein